MRPIEIGCLACKSGDRNERCQDSFARIGVVRAHWDCWERCNLSCQFCFRSHSNPIDTESARLLLEALAYSGVTHMVFTGGDPSLRQDLSELIRYAKSLGMFVEVLTNAHHRPHVLAQLLAEADLIGVSLDGPTAEVHDKFRNKKNNFDRVNTLLDILDEDGRPYIVRTLVSAENALHIPDMADLMGSRKMLSRWGIQQFSPVEEGYLNRERYGIGDDEYESIVTALHGSVSTELQPKISTLSVNDRIGLYLLLNPSGEVFGRDFDTKDGTFPTVGSVFTDHLVDLSEALSFDRAKHERRYADWFDQGSA